MVDVRVFIFFMDGFRFLFFMFWQREFFFFLM